MPDRTRRVPRLVSALPLSALITLSACDNGNPIRNDDVVTRLTLSPASDFLKVGQTESFSAQATRTNGSTETVVATWGTDAPSVVAIESGGLVRGLSSGDATIWADYQGMRADRRLRVAPDYQGTWVGAYRNMDCSATGAWADEDMCDEMEWVGAAFALHLRLLQTRSSVTGTVALDDLMGEATGQIAVHGTLALNGSVSFEAEGIRITCALADWDSMADGDRMTGRFTEVWTIDGVSGDMRLPSTLETVQRISASSERGLETGQAGVIAGAKSLRKLRALLGTPR